MKTLLRTFCLAAVAVALPFMGCKKKEETAAASGEGDKPKQEAAPPPKPTVELPLKWQVGKRYHFRQETADTTEMANSATPTQSTKMEGTDVNDYTLTVLAERPNGAGHEVELEFISRKAQQKVPGVTNAAMARQMLNFDSAQPASRDGVNPMAKMYRKMIGKKLVYLTDPAGRIEGIKDHPEFLKKLTYGISPSSTEAQLLKLAFTENNAKQMDYVPTGLPGKPVREGDTWKLQTSLSMAQLAAYGTDMNITFKGHEEKDGKKLAALEIQGAVVNKMLAAASGSNQPQAQQQPSMAADSGAADPNAGRNSVEPGNEGMASQSAPPPAAVPGQVGTITGKILFDPELSMIVESAQTRQLTITTPPVQGRTFTTTMNQNITTKLLDVKDAGGASPAAPKEAPKADTKTDAAK